MPSEGDRLPVVLMAAIPVLTFKFGWGFVHFQARRKRGVRAFRKALLGNGMPRDQASRLTQAYHDAGSLRKILRNAVVSRF